MDMKILTYIMVSMTTHLVLINGILFNLGGIHNVPNKERLILFIGMFLMLVVLGLLTKYGEHTMLTIKVSSFSRTMPSLHIVPVIAIVVGYAVSTSHPLLLGLGISSCFCGWQYTRILMTVRHHVKYNRKES